MPSLSLPKTALLTQSAEYQKVYKSGKRLRGQNFSLIYLANDRPQHRLGISVHGVKLAVRRNRIKRIIREFFRLNRGCADSGFGGERTPKMDFVLAVRPEFALDSPAAVAAVVQPLLQKVGMVATRSRLSGPVPADPPLV